MPPLAPHCRLFVLLARDAKVGVILRRGPSKWVQLIKWSTDTDEFEPGQWFKGRIYETGCDLSPNGNHMIYLAAKRNAGTVNKEIGEVWTAISRPPYLTAVALWPLGDTWHGGGVFQSNTCVVINHPPEKMFPYQDCIPPDKVKVICAEDNVEASSVGPQRRENGWTVIKQWAGFVAETGGVSAAFTSKIADVRPSEMTWLRKIHGNVGQKDRGYVTLGSAISEKRLPGADSSLISRVAYVGLDQFADFAIRNAATGQRYPIENATWADFDQSGRLVFVAYGKIYAGRLGPNGVETRELADFNANRFEEVDAPEWAKKW